MLRFLPFLAILLLSTGVFTSGAARASCGDWLAHAGSSDAAAATQVDPAAHATAAGQPSEMPCPCRGPGCGQSPSGSMPAPATPATERSRDVACWKVEPTEVPFMAARLLAASSLTLPSGASLDIERPPQS